MDSRCHYITHLKQRVFIPGCMGGVQGGMPACTCRKFTYRFCPECGARIGSDGHHMPKQTNRPDAASP